MNSATEPMNGTATNLITTDGSPADITPLATNADADEQQLFASPEALATAIREARCVESA